MKATAAVFHGPGRPFEHTTWPLPRPAGTEVLVQVIACTLCGSDLHSIHGRRAVATPSVLGHEILGRIAAFGPVAPRVDAAGQPINTGDRVTWAIVASCGACATCQRDLPQKCEHGFKYGHEPLQPGRELAGGLADFALLVPGTALFRVPDTLSDETACPASCATATVAAALERAGPIAGRAVLILGAGMLGVTAAAWSRTLDASHVLVCDPNPDRLAAAATFGATDTTSPAELADSVATLTRGRGADLALELSGAPDSLEATLPLLATGATLTLVGSVAPSRPVAFPPEQIVRRCLTIQGLHNYAPRHLHAALAFLARHHDMYPFASLVAPWQPLPHLDTLIAAGTPPEFLRIGIRPR
jgi:alcohol dehydrogenase